VLKIDQGFRTRFGEARLEFGVNALRSGVCQISERKLADMITEAGQLVAYAGQQEPLICAIGNLENLPKEGG
jgi:hypothetical protein